MSFECEVIVKLDSAISLNLKEFEFFVGLIFLCTKSFSMLIAVLGS